MIDLNEFAKEVHNNAVEPGWWEDDRGFGEMIALCHSELSEALRYRALEEYRNGCGAVEVYYTNSKCKESGTLCAPDAQDECTGNPEECGAYERGKPEGLAVELADCIIRICK